MAEHGAYNFTTAELTTSDTKVYEKKMGISPEIAIATNLPAGESFHLSLNNYVTFDNCIPPRGFTNKSYATFDGEPIGYSYPDGQYWDYTEFDQIDFKGYFPPKVMSFLIKGIYSSQIKKFY